MLRDCVIILVTLFKAVGETTRFIKDPYQRECKLLGIKCHQEAICQIDQVTRSFFCECLPGFVGDGEDNCQETSAEITVLNKSACDISGLQYCVIITMPGKEAAFNANVKGKLNQYQIRWYKLYSSQGPKYYSYRRHLSPPASLLPETGLMKHSLTLELYNIKEDDFYPNMFWVEMDTKKMTEKMVTIEPFDFTGFDIINPSKLRYFFVLERIPIDVGEFLEGDTVVITLNDIITTSISSYIRWTKEPDNFTLFGNATVLGTNTEGIQINRIKKDEFGYFRAVIFDFTSLIPVRTMVEQRRFLLQKDISKVCNGERSEKNCKCNPGFIGNGIHCVDIDECSGWMPLKCLPKALCINTFGSYLCQCPTGFEGDGFYTCTDIDECLKNLHNCHINATCVNTVGSFVCLCKSSFIGNGKICTSRSIWTPWSPWSICTASCGFEEQMRIRECTNPESGVRCMGPSTDLKLCPAKKECPVDGQWSQWSPWSICSNHCSGIKRRVRICDNPEPANNGKPCRGVAEETETCFDDSCPVDGIWSAWTSWTLCPISCGLSTVKRIRYCNNPAPNNGGEICNGYRIEQRSCGFPKMYCKYLGQ